MERPYPVVLSVKEDEGGLEEDTEEVQDSVHVDIEPFPTVVQNVLWT